MKDRFTEAMEELQQKSPFVCASCNEHHDIAMEHGSDAHGEIIRDRFTEAVEESEEKSAFVCESCRH
jgi:hypothetical protein